MPGGLDDDRVSGFQVSAAPGRRACGVLRTRCCLPPGHGHVPVVAIPWLAHVRAGAFLDGAFPVVGRTGVSTSSR